MFQTLLWSFRRWAIYHLTAPDLEGSLQDYTWDTMLDLVRQFAPEGLRDFGTVWLSPTNVGDRSDLLEELNSYFLFLVDSLETSIQDDDDELQNDLAQFLDETMTACLEEWLKGREEYRIYPTLEESADTFPTGRIFVIMQRILEAHIRGSHPEPQPDAAPEAVADVTPVPVPAPEPEPAAAPVPVPEPDTAVAPVAVPPTSIREALRIQNATRRARRAGASKQTRKQKNRAPVRT